MRNVRSFLKNGKAIRSVLLLFTDIIAINIALVFSFFVRYDKLLPEQYSSEIKVIIPILILSYLLPLISFKMYRSLWRNAGFDEFVEHRLQLL